MAGIIGRDIALIADDPLPESRSYDSMPFAEPPLEPKSDLYSLAARAVVNVEQDENTGHWLVRDGCSVVFAGPERFAREFVAERARKPARRPQLIGS